MQQYLLPVDVLLATMRGVQATVVLRAPIAALPEERGGACIAELRLVRGRPYRCTISSMEGQLLLQQADAFHMLGQLGELRWTLQASFSSEAYHATESQTAPSAKGYGWKIVVPLLPTVLETLAHREKQVLLLVETRKRPEEIAQLLCLSPEHVEHMLQRLKDLHLLVAQEPERSQP